MNGTLPTEQTERDAETRTKLLDAAQTDPGAPFKPAAVAVLRMPRTEDPASWQRARTTLKAIDEVRIGDLDRATTPAFEGGDGKQGRPVEWDDPEPWPEPVNVADLLDELEAKVERYVDFPGGGSDAAETAPAVLMGEWGGRGMSAQIAAYGRLATDQCSIETRTGKAITTARLA